MKTILSALSTIGMLGLFIGFPLGIFFSIRAYYEKEPMKKKKEQKKALWSVLGPILLIVLSVILFAIVGTTTTSVQ